uniref:Vesicle transport protein GOT1B n=1 Tax=Strigamia maritima TaxID=126957 RepID=T1IXV0_STRMM
MIEISDTQKIGVGLAGFGIVFLFLGTLLLFDKDFIFVWVGVCYRLGKNVSFFFQRHKIKASLAFFGGILIVLIGFPLIGMIVETYGFILLFSGFFPAVITFLRRVPVLGSILNLPGLGGLLDRLAGDTSRTPV